MKNQPVPDPTSSVAIQCLILTHPRHTFMRRVCAPSLQNCCLYQCKHYDEYCRFLPASLISGFCCRNGSDPVLSPSLLLHLLDAGMVSLQLSRHLLLMQTILWSSLSPSSFRATLGVVLQTYTSSYGHKRKSPELRPELHSGVIQGVLHLLPVLNSVIHCNLLDALPAQPVHTIQSFKACFPVLRLRSAAAKLQWQVSALPSLCVCFHQKQGRPRYTRPPLTYPTHDKRNHPPFIWPIHMSNQRMRNDRGMRGIRRHRNSHRHQCLCSLLASRTALEYTNAVAVQEVVRQPHLGECMSAFTAVFSIVDCFSQRSYRAERLSKSPALHR